MAVTVSLEAFREPLALRRGWGLRRGPGRAIAIALGVSLALHVLVVVPMALRLARRAAPQPPPSPVMVELIQQNTPTVGDGPQAVTPPPSPPAPEPAPPAPPPPETPPVPAPAPVPAKPVAQAAPPLPRPAPARRAVAKPPTADVKPSPPEAKPADTKPTDEVPTIRLGEGGDPGTGLVSGDNIIPASPDAAVRNKPIAYPPGAANLGEEGAVTLLIHVGPDGRPLSVEVTETSGYDRLDRAASEGVMRWKFRPAHQGGTPVASTLPITVRFELTN